MKDFVCPVCKGSDFRENHNGPIRNGKFPNNIDGIIIYRCNDCTTEFHNHTINYQDNFYRNFVNGSDNVSELRLILEKELPHQIEIVENHFQNLDEVRYLDVGCGIGLLLKHFKGKFTEVWGIEKNASFIEHLGNNHIKVCSDVNEISSEKFDLITSFNVIEHVNDPFQFLEELLGLLSDKGTLILETPNSNDYMIDIVGNRFKQFFYRLQHRTYLSTDSFKFMLTKMGYASNDYLIQSSQKYGIENLIHWIQEGGPGSFKTFTFSSELNEKFKTEIQSQLKGDHLQLILKKKF